MDTHSSTLLLKDLAIIVVAATVSMRVFSLLRLPLLLGFIIVGILLSPVFGVISSAGNISALGELGVMFMMFFVGMEFNLERLKKVFAPSVLGISFQIAAMGILGMVAAGIMGLSKVDGVFLGGVLAMSSTIVIVEIFAQRRDLSKLYAQIAIGILIIEDIFAVFLLVVLSGLSSGELPKSGELLRSTLVLLSFMISIFVVGKLLVPRLLRRFAVSGNRQELIMVIFCLIMGLGELAEMSKLSLSLGAFMAGSIISGSDVSRRVENITDPFRNLFVALFFVSIGTQINPSMVLELWLPIVLISLAVIVFQTLACFCGIVLGGVRCRDAYLAAVNKAQIGEFSFVIAGLGISSGVMNPSIMVIAMGVSFLTVFLNPFVAGQSERIMRIAHKLAPRKLLEVLEIYRRAVSAFSRGEKSAVAAFLPSLGAIFVYTLMFSGLMFVAAHFADSAVQSQRAYSRWIALGVWIAAGGLSVPMLAGVLKSAGACAAKFADALDSRYNLESLGGGGKLHVFLRGVFSAFIMLAFATVYFVFVFNFLPIGNAFAVFGASVLLMSLFFRRIFSNFRHSMEGKFSTVLKRHLENAEHSRRELMMDNVRSSHSWARSVSEIEIGEFADAAGKTVGELDIRGRTGAEIAAVKRGAFVIYEISADTRLFPDDIVILCASERSITEAEKILTRPAPISATLSEDSNLSGTAVLEDFAVSADTAVFGKNLKELALPKTYGIKVMAVLCAGDVESSQPDPLRAFEAGDKILFMGTKAALEKMAGDMRLIRE